MAPLPFRYELRHSSRGHGWAEDKFDASRFDAIAAKGMLPIVSWEP